MRSLKMKNLRKIINRFDKARVLVIGDLILDEYIWGNVERISPEAPVPIIWADKRTYVPGGAANVAGNIRSLNGKVYLVGVVGNDKNKDKPIDPKEMKSLLAKCDRMIKNREIVFQEDLQAKTSDMYRLKVPRDRQAECMANMLAMVLVDSKKNQKKTLLEYIKKNYSEA